MDAKVGELWISQWNNRVICITESDYEIVKFYFIDTPEEKQSRAYRIFYSVFVPYK